MAPETRAAIVTATARRITADDAADLHDGIIRAIDQGLRIRTPDASERFGDKTYWTIDSVSTPGWDYIVMVEQRPDGEVWVYCECAQNTIARKVCKHIALALDNMGLIPRTERA